MYLVCTGHKSTYADFSNYKVQGRSNSVIQCFDTGGHRGHVFMLYLAWSGDQAFLTVDALKDKKVLENLCGSGATNLSLSGWTYCINEIIKILLFF